MGAVRGCKKCKPLFGNGSPMQASSSEGACGVGCTHGPEQHLIRCFPQLAPGGILDLPDALPQLPGQLHIPRKENE